MIFFCTGAGHSITWQKSSVALKCCMDDVSESGFPSLPRLMRFTPIKGNDVSN
ncbi:hypothetical protein Plhal304r1_c017g0062451 [Plasmopara halstedii]